MNDHEDSSTGKAGSKDDSDLALEELKIQNKEELIKLERDLFGNKADMDGRGYVERYWFDINKDLFKRREYKIQL